MIKVAINGFGRIGRAFARLIYHKEIVSNIDIVAINDLSDKEDLLYLFKYDSVYGKAKKEAVEKLSNAKFFSEKDPENLPWANLGIDVVLESTGIFKTKELAQKHIKAGAKNVVVSAPSSDIDMILVGINDEKLKDLNISSNASCTTNSVALLLDLLHRNFEVEKAHLSTTHAYTSSQSLHDAISKKDPRRKRAGAINIIPTSTGAAKATAKVLSFLEGKFAGSALRVPVPSGSIAELFVLLSKKTDLEAIKQVIKDEASRENNKFILSFTGEPVVSSDILGEPVAGMVDLSQTELVDGDFLKVSVWYDNEYGYTASLIQHIIKTASN